MQPPFPDAHAIGWKDHLIQSLRHRIGVAGQHHHIGSVAIKPQLEHCPQPSGCCQPTALLQNSRHGLPQVSGGLTLQEIPGPRTVQSDDGERFIPVRRHHQPLNAAAQAEISDKRNRLISSRPAFSMAAAPPSSLSTIVTTRFTR